MAYDPNFRRNKLAEQLLQEIVRGIIPTMAVNQDMNISIDLVDSWVNTAFFIADRFILATKPAQEDPASASVEADEFSDLPIVDSEAL